MSVIVRTYIDYSCDCCNEKITIGPENPDATIDDDTTLPKKWRRLNVGSRVHANGSEQQLHLCGKCWRQIEMRLLPRAHA